MPEPNRDKIAADWAARGSAAICGLIRQASDGRISCTLRMNW